MVGKEPSNCCDAVMTAYATACPQPEEADIRPLDGIRVFDPSPTSVVHCGNGFDARFEAHHSGRKHWTDGIVSGFTLASSFSTEKCIFVMFITFSARLPC
jgi:hypothetical protein